MFINYVTYLPPAIIPIVSPIKKITINMIAPNHMSPLKNLSVASGCGGRGRGRAVTGGCIAGFADTGGADAGGADASFGGAIGIGASFFTFFFLLCSNLLFNLEKGLNFFLSPSTSL